MDPEDKPKWTFENAGLDVHSDVDLWLEIGHMEEQDEPPTKVDDT